MEKKKKLFLIFIFLLAFFLRFYKLGEVPNGLYQDETAIGYNAYSILKTGRDEHNQPFPLYFRSFGDYKLPLYIYLSIVPIKFFGLNPFSVRFISALSGVFTVILIYFLVDIIFKNKNLVILTTLLTAVNPWHLHYSRATFEVSLSLFLIVLGTILFYLGLEKRKNVTFFPFGVMILALALYTYNLTRLLVPLFISFYFYFWKSEIKKISRKIVLLSVILAFLILLPFFFTFLKEGGYSSAKGTLIWSSATVQSKILEFRAFLLHFPFLASKLFFNRWLLTVWQYFLNFLSYFSVVFFFISGSSHGNHGIGNFGQFYPLELFFMILGATKLFEKDKRNFNFLVIWFLIVVGVASLTREAPHATRGFFLIFPLEVFSACGVMEFLKRLKNAKRTLGKILGGLLLLGGIYSLVFYFTSYYFRFPLFYARFWRSADKEISLYLKENEPKYEKIIISEDSDLIYSSLLFYQVYKPEKFQKEAEWVPPDSEGFSFPKKFGKYEFRKIDWEKDLSRGNLIIAKEGEKPQGFVPAKVFYYPSRPVFLGLKQEIVNYSVSEVAYEVFEGK